MKVKIIKTGETKTVNNSYGMRLIGQGRAVLAKDTSAEKKQEKKSTKVAAGE